jgi:tRNA (cytidine/uridine-2'-O-)-methyltransferase
MAGRFQIVLYQPVIPQNTGSIARLCACTNAVLHLIHPLGFRTDEASVKRAGLDYWAHVDVREHADWDAFMAAEKPQELFFFEKDATRAHSEVRYPPGAYLVFGPETSAIPAFLAERYPDRQVLVPMRTHLVRSLNLAQCAAVALYEALRQTGYESIHATKVDPE